MSLYKPDINYLLTLRDNNKRHKRIVYFLKHHPNEIKKINNGSIIHKLIRNGRLNGKTLLYFIKIFPEGLFVKDDRGILPIHIIINHFEHKLFNNIITTMLNINPIGIDCNKNTVLHIYILNMKRCIKHNLDFIKYICLNHKEMLFIYNNDFELPIHTLCKERSVNYDIISEIIEILIDSSPELLLMKSNLRYPIELLPTSNYNAIVLCLNTKYDNNIINDVLFNVWNTNHILHYRMDRIGLLKILFKINNKKLIAENCEKYISNIEFVFDIPIVIKNTINLLNSYYRLLELYNVEYGLLFSECDLEEIGISKEAIKFGRSIEDMVELI
jgi:hypothetical protein